MNKILAVLLVSLGAFDAGARATTIDQISSNVNGMRELTPANIVQQFPGSAPYYGPAVCQQTLPFVEKNLTSFDPAYTCSCPDPKAPPVCSGPAHYQQATVKCTAETPFGSSTPPPLGGPNNVPQDFSLNPAIPGDQPVQNCTLQGGCTQSYTPPGMTCGYPANSNAAVSTAPTSCAALGLTTAWLTQYAGWGVYSAGSYSRYGGVSSPSGYPNVCVVALVPPGTPDPSTPPAATAANPLPWPYQIVPCDNLGQPDTAATAAAESCQVFQAACSPTFVEGYIGYGNATLTSLTGAQMVANPPPAGQAGWSGPMMVTSSEIGGGPDTCEARFACTGTPQTSVPFEIMCWGSNGGDTGLHLGSLTMPTGPSNYPNTPNGGVDYQTVNVAPNWGCSGSYTGSQIPVTANVECDGPICQVHLEIASSGGCAGPNQCGAPTWVTAGDGWVYPSCGCGQAYSASTGACVGHTTAISWILYRDNYQPLCPAGTTFKPALNLCTTN